MKSKRLRLILGGAAVLLPAFAAFTAWRLPNLLTEQLTRNLPLRVAEPAAWSGFLQVTLGGVELPHPNGGRRPPVISIRSATVRVPWWALLMRPMPVELELDTPRVTLDAELRDSLPREVGFLPVGLKIREGRIEVLDAQTRPDGPLTIIDHLRVDLWMTSPLQYPSVHLDAAAQFVTKEGKPVGSLSAGCQAGATLKQMEGKLEIWYDRLEDFRWVYQAAPEPFTFDGGAGGPVIRWEYEEGRLKASVQCRAKNLRIGGAIGGEVPWQQVLDALANRNGEIDITVTTEGVWGDPGFDVHNRLLSELDWAIKERVAAKGVRVSGRIFYGLFADLI